MMGFSDSNQFRFEDGVVKHHRVGGEYKDRLMDGVELDRTLKWDSEVMVKIIYLDDGEETVGERKMKMMIDESSKNHVEKKGEKKFKRERKIPVKKKKYPTKPKRWNKRLTKVANHIDLNHVFDENCECEGIMDELNEKYWKEKEERVYTHSTPSTFSLACARYLDDIIYSIWDKYRVNNNSWDFLYDSSDISSDEERLS